LLTRLEKATDEKPAQKQTHYAALDHPRRGSFAAGVSGPHTSYHLIHSTMDEALLVQLSKG